MMAIQEGRPAVAGPAAPSAMQKQVTQQGGFMLYLPAGWKAEEGRDTNLDMPRVAAPAPLRPHRLADGSASFQIPAA
jgi:hypothetical protein